jgi:hypothetical protein
MPFAFVSGAPKRGNIRPDYQLSRAAIKRLGLESAPPAAGVRPRAR